MSQTQKYLLAALVTVVIGAALFLRLQSVVKVTGGREEEEKVDNPLDQARAQLRQANDLSACRNALSHLNRHLAGEKMPEWTEAQKGEIQRDLNLDERELKEVTRSSFTLLDGIHLERNLMLRNIARGLSRVEEPDRRKREQQEAAAALAWTVRNIQLSNPTAEAAIPEENHLPLTQVLRMGAGGALHRAQLFVDLMDQLDHDACLLAFPGVTAEGSPRYWACGVLNQDGKIALYDTRLGMPIPAPGGEGVATLDQLCVRESLVLQQLKSGSDRYDVSSEDAIGAEVHLPVPLSALAPRMHYLQEQALPAVEGGRVADRDAKDRFAAALKAINHAGIVRRVAWAARVEHRFHTVEEGGVSTTPRAELLVAKHTINNAGAFVAALPPQLLPSKEKDFFEAPLIHGFDFYYDHFRQFFFHSNSPRNFLLRGELQEAARQLDTILEQMQRDQARFKQNYSAKDLPKLLQLLDRAVVDVGRGQENLAIARLREIDPAQAQYFEIFVTGVIAEGLIPHAAFLRALIKHELAELIQLHQGVEEACQAWVEVCFQWRHYRYHHAATLPGAAARVLLAQAQHRLAENALRRAEAEATHRAEARDIARTALDLWKDLAQQSEGLTALGYRLQAKRVEQMTKRLKP